jgi:hypothetical protein
MVLKDMLHLSKVAKHGVLGGLFRALIPIRTTGDSDPSPGARTARDESTCFAAITTF